MPRLADAQLESVTGASVQIPDAHSFSRDSIRMLVISGVFNSVLVSIEVSIDDSVFVGLAEEDGTLITYTQAASIGIAIPVKTRAPFMRVITDAAGDVSTLVTVDLI